MILIFGLGNPGNEFSKTRHNAGFLMLDEVQKTFNFSDWEQKNKFKAEISEGTIEDEKIILAKPSTYMNTSGKSAKLLVSYYKILTKNFFVFNDDLDLPFGEFKISKNKNSAGHKGVQSIIDELKTKDFTRFRIGIGTENPKPDAKTFVLKKFTKKEQSVLKKILKNVCRALKIAITQSPEIAMAEFNK